MESLKKEMSRKWALKKGQIWKQGKGGWQAFQGQGRVESWNRVGSKPEESQRQGTGGSLIVGECYFSSMNRIWKEAPHSGALFLEGVVRIGPPSEQRSFVG